MELIQILWIAILSLTAILFASYLVVLFYSTRTPCMCKHIVVLPILLLLLLVGVIGLYMDLGRDSLPEFALDAVNSLNDLVNTS